MSLRHPFFSLRSLTVCRTTGAPLIRNISLAVGRGEIHLIMGPNGSGKSSLLLTIMGHPAYSITKGTIRFDGNTITSLKPHERARQGLFLAFQNPVELRGVPFANAVQAGANPPLNPTQRAKLIHEAFSRVSLDTNFTYRSLNDGWSGGEKKKGEMAQLLLAHPRLALIDEIDSGLDVTALKDIIGTIKDLNVHSKTSFIIVTHNPELAERITPTRIHVLVGGTIVASGSASLARAIAKNGYPTKP